MPPQINARLISVEASASTTEDWDVASASTGSAVKYTGSAGAYVMEKIRTVYSDRAGALMKQKDVTILIDASLRDVNGNELKIATGDIITYTVRGQQYKRYIMDWHEAYLPGLNLQEYIRIHLNPQPVETAAETD